jgi:hypothetical protein
MGTRRGNGGSNSGSKLPSLLAPPVLSTFSLFLYFLLSRPSQGEQQRRLARERTEMNKE